MDTCNFFTWQGGTPIKKFPKPMFRKYHAHFELPKVKVATLPSEAITNTLKLES
jgi:hypothetical protein